MHKGHSEFTYMRKLRKMPLGLLIYTVVRKNFRPNATLEIRCCANKLSFHS